MYNRLYFLIVTQKTAVFYQGYLSSLFYC